MTGNASAPFKTILRPYSEGNEKNCFVEPKANTFNVRSKNYLSDGKKVSGVENLYELLGLDLVKNNNMDEKNQLLNVSLNKKFSLCKARKNGFKDFVFTINYVLPNMNFVVYFRPRREFETEEIMKELELLSHATGGEKELKPYMTGIPKHDARIETFLNGDKEMRDKKLKIIPKLVEGNWILRKLVTGKPAIIGTKLDTQWFDNINEGYVELDLILGTSRMATTIINKMQNQTKYICCDLAFVIQGDDQEELPEEIFMAVRFNAIDLDVVKEYEDLEELD